MGHDGIIIILILGLIAFDIITGLIKAVQLGEFSSREMRAGLLRKSGTIFLVALAYGLQYAAALLPELPEELGVVFNGVALYVVLMEAASVVENILQINPDLGGDKIRGFFGLNHNEPEGDTNEN